MRTISIRLDEQTDAALQAFCRAHGVSQTNAVKNAIARLAEHPIVSDLIAIGATAAVTAIAAGMSSKSGKTSGKAVKDAGKAAAAAIGARLMTEFQAVKDSAAEAKKKKA